MYSHTVLTNDDGPTPLLFAAAQVLREILPQEFRLLVAPPDRERSWGGTAVRGRGVITVEEHHNPVHHFRLSGTPAGCASWAVQQLIESGIEAKDVLVVSGVNIGSNAGRAFGKASATIGAAIHATTLNIKPVAAAMSQAMTHPIYRGLKEGSLTDAEIDALTNDVKESVRQSMTYFYEHVEQVPTGTVMSFNFPEDRGSAPKVIRSHFADTSIREAWVLQDDGKYHFKAQLVRGKRERQPVDMDVIEAGNISASIVPEWD